MIDNCPAVNAVYTLDILAATTYISSPNVYWIYIFADVFELICIVFSSCVVSFGLAVFITTPIFHQHLIRLFFCVAVIYYTIVTFRIVPILIHFYYGYPTSTKLELFSCVDWIATFEYIRFGAMGCYAACIKCIVFERFLAIFNLSTYERHSYICFTLLGIFAQLTVGLCSFLLLYYEMINIIIVVLSAAIANIFSCTFFMTAEKINNRLYKNASKSNSGYTLSQRYQMVENIKTTHILKRALNVCFILNLVLEICVITNSLSTQKVVRQIALVSFNFTIVVYSISFVAMALSGSDIWSREALIRLRKIRRMVSCFNRVDTSPAIKNGHHVLRDTRGHQMNFKSNEEGDQHFISLKNLWDTRFDEPR